MKRLRGNAKGQLPNLRRCYVYEIRVDGVVRYIGKGCNDRIYSHLIEARRTASRSEVKIREIFLLGAKTTVRKRNHRLSFRLRGTSTMVPKRRWMV